MLSLLAIANARAGRCPERLSFEHANALAATGCNWSRRCTRRGKRRRRRERLYLVRGDVVVVLKIF